LYAQVLMQATSLSNSNNDVGGARSAGVQGMPTFIHCFMCTDYFLVINVEKWLSNP